MRVSQRPVSVKIRDKIEKQDHNLKFSTGDLKELQSFVDEALETILLEHQENETEVILVNGKDGSRIKELDVRSFEGNIVIEVTTEEILRRQQSAKPKKMTISDLGNVMIGPNIQFKREGSLSNQNEPPSKEKMEKSLRENIDSPPGHKSEAAPPAPKKEERVQEAPKRRAPKPFLTGEVHILPKSNKNTYPLFCDVKEQMPPFSMVNSKYLSKIKAPTPCYLKHEDLIEKQTRTKEFMLRKFIVKNNGELKVNDPEMVAKSRKLLPKILGRIFEAIKSGRGLQGVSIPISFMVPESMTQKSLLGCALYPQFFTKAASKTSPVERMKDVITGIVAGYHLSVSSGKPFNPYLGETVEGYFQDGTKLYAEQTSHYPPITNILLMNRDWKFYGGFEFNGHFGGNSMELAFVGSSKIEFNDGQVISTFPPILKLKGLMFGERRMSFAGSFKFQDKDNKLKGLVPLGDKKLKRKDAFLGKIYTYDPSKESFSKKPKGVANVKEQAKIDKTYADLVKEISSISGSLYDQVEIDGSKRWVADQILPFKFIPAENPLPSDARYREDFVYVMHNKESLAEEWKFHLEETQRNDEKMRNDHKKKK